MELKGLREACVRKQSVLRCNYTRWCQWYCNYEWSSRRGAFGKAGKEGRVCFARESHQVSELKLIFNSRQFSQRHRVGSWRKADGERERESIRRKCVFNENWFPGATRVCVCAWERERVSEWGDVSIREKTEMEEGVVTRLRRVRQRQRESETE